MSAWASSMSYALVKGTSPPSPTRQSSYGLIRVDGWMERIMLEAFLISRGPCLAPGRFVTAPSYGTPIMAMSNSDGSSIKGARMKVAISM